MERKKSAMRIMIVALAALVLAGLVPHSAWADSDKKKDKKGPVVVIGPITKTDDPAPKKK